MTILAFGDIVGKIGREAIKKILPELKEKFSPDLVIANAENLAHGKGVTEKTCQEMLEVGVDLLTSGNHVWKKEEVYKIFNEKKIPLLRPANYPPQVPGEGYKIIEVGTRKVLVVNLIGRVFMDEQFDCPFRGIDEILAGVDSKELAAVLVDFHGEATSERIALGWYLDGRVSALWGTHTHIPTADQKILPGGTAYVTDVGMVGAHDSVIGMGKEKIIESFLTQINPKLEIPEEGHSVVNGILIEIDPKTRRAIRIDRVDREVIV